MRRLPDKDGQPALSDKDIESSNATLHTLFGHSVQKPWMMGPGHPVRPSPRRASTSKAPAPLPVTLAQETIAAVLPSPAPSDDPSPVLAHSPEDMMRNENPQVPYNNENHHPHNTNNINHTRNPHPSPAEPPSQPTNTRPTNLGINIIQLPNVRPQHQFEEVQIPESSRTMTNLPPLPDEVLLQSDHQTRQELQSPTFQEQPSPHGPLFPRNSSSGSATTTASRVNEPPKQAQGQNPHQWMNDGEQLPGPFQTHTSSPMTNSNLMLPSSIIQNQLQSRLIVGNYSGTAPSHPPKRQRTQPPMMPSLKPHVALVESHIAAAGGLGVSKTNLEIPRLQLLKEACNSEDYFYVALHQIFCVWDLDRAQITQIFSFPRPSLLQVAFNVLKQLIYDNDQLAPNYKKWFAQFPSPLPDLMRASEPYRRIVHNVGGFLVKLASEWGLFSKECTDRGFPPLVDELIGRMLVLSPTLQKVLFNASRRHIGVRDHDGIQPEIDEIFRKDQQYHQAFSAHIIMDRPISNREFTDRDIQISQDYRMLINQNLQRRQALASAAGSYQSRVPTSLATGSGRLQGAPNPQQGADQVVSQRNFLPRSLNPTGNPQFSSQQSWVTTASSPNLDMLSVARLPSSVNGHRVPYANTPSPVMMQNLSMQSPVQQTFQLAVLRNQMDPHQMQQNFGEPNANIVGYQSLDQSQHPLHRHLQVQQAPSAQLRPTGQQHYQQQQPQIHTTQLPPPLMSPQQFQEFQSQQLANRTAQYQPNGNSNPAPQQRVPFRANSISNNGRRTPNMNPSNKNSPTPTNALDIRLQDYENPLIPPLGFYHGRQQPNSFNTALHQAHLRSPRLVPIEPFPETLSREDPSRRFYQAVKALAHDPWKIHAVPISCYEFSVPNVVFPLIAQGEAPGKGQLENRKFRSGTLQYRMRCIKRSKNEVNCEMADWVVADTVWPENICFMINENQLELRRKSHHGKDLPIDITAYARAAGPDVKNRIVLSSIGRSRQQFKDFSYFFAVEVIEVLDHQHIMRTTRHKPAHETLNAIMKSLAGPSHENYDDIPMVTSDLSIDLADPFTTVMFQVPVKGGTCLHRECFDLEAFLVTRLCKPKTQGKGEPSMVDIWKCPLCGKDARPYTLMIDDFLAGVKEDLIKRGEGNIKGIWIGQDGKWRPKEETSGRNFNDTEDGTSTQDEKSDDERNGNKNTLQQRKSSRVFEVIELDDD